MHDADFAQNVEDLESMIDDLEEEYDDLERELDDVDEDFVAEMRYFVDRLLVIESERTRLAARELALRIWGLRREGELRRQRDSGVPPLKQCRYVTPPGRWAW